MGAFEFLGRVESLSATAEGAARAAITMLIVATRCRINHSDGGAAAATLNAMPAAERLQVLKLLVAAQAPTAELAAVVRVSVVGDDGRYLRDEHEPDMSERMLAVWSGLTPAVAGWGKLTQLDRIVCITRLIAAGYPASDGFDGFMRALLTETDREAAIVAWCRERTWTASEAEVAWLAHTTRAMARLEAMASVLARTLANRPLATEWISDADQAWRAAPKDNLGRALADARFSAVLSAADDLASAEGLLGHAIQGAERENEPKERARIYRIALEAAAGLAVHDARGSAVEPWLRAVEKLTNDKVLLRQRESFLDARAGAVRTLPRAALTGGDSAVDRGHQVLKEMCRRVPERWLDLLHQATIVSLQAKSGRSTELQFSTIGDALRKDGIPRPIPNITLDEVMRLLVPASPERVMAIGDRLAHPVQRALWWATAAPYAQTRQTSG